MKKTFCLLLLLCVLTGCNSEKKTSGRQNINEETSDQTSRQEDVPYHVKKGIEMSKVQVVQIEGKELIYLPQVKFTESSIDVEHHFYEYDNGELKEVKISR